MSDDANLRVQQFDRHLDKLCAEEGIELDAAERQRIFGLSVAEGFTDLSTVRAFSEFVDGQEAPVWEDDEPEPEPDAPSPGQQALAQDLKADLERLREKIRRPLLPDEIETFARNATDQISRTGGYDRDKASEGFKGYGEMTPDEVNETMVRRARELEGPQEVDEDRTFDLSNRQDWEDYAFQKLNGAEFEDSFVDAPDEAA